MLVRAVETPAVETGETTESATGSETAETTEVAMGVVVVMDGWRLGRQGRMAGCPVDVERCASSCRQALALLGVVAADGWLRVHACACAVCRVHAGALRLT